jgi:hypothetical protein
MSTPGKKLPFARSLSEPWYQGGIQIVAGSVKKMSLAILFGRESEFLRLFMRFNAYFARPIRQKIAILPSGIEHSSLTC